LSATQASGYSPERPRGLLELLPGLEPI